MQNDSEKKESIETSIFNFKDDSNDDFELILPPECEIKQYEAGADFELHFGAMQPNSGCTHEKRVSFDSTKNQYYVLERRQRETDTLFETDDEFCTSEFEIDLGIATDIGGQVYDLKIAHEAPSPIKDDMVDDGRMKIEALNEVEAYLQPQTEVAYIETETESDTQQTEVDSFKKEDEMKISLDSSIEVKMEHLPENILHNVSNAQRVVVENIPSLKNNPFIMRDRMGTH
ncbi:hypothetical protein GINT2_001512 [Glugoides intestinalis]